MYVYLSHIDFVSWVVVYLHVIAYWDQDLTLESLFAIVLW